MPCVHPAWLLTTVMAKTLTAKWARGAPAQPTPTSGSTATAVSGDLATGEEI